MSGNKHDSRKDPTARNWEAFVYVKLCGYSHRDAAKLMSVKMETVNYHIQEFAKLCENRDELLRNARFAAMGLVGDALNTTKHNIVAKKNQDAATATLKGTGVFVQHDKVRSEVNHYMVNIDPEETRKEVEEAQKARRERLREREEAEHKREEQTENLQS